MRPHYTSILFFVFAFFTQIASAQLVANDDSVTVNGSGIAMVGPNFFNVRTNDTYNGNPFSVGFVSITQISTSNPNVNISGGNVFVQQGTPVGIYTLVYQICLTSNPGICDTATVTVTVCFQDTPIVQTPTCQTPLGTLLVSGLPAGNWTLTQRNNSVDTTITGSGASYLATGLTLGGYQYRVTNASGCTSAFSQTVYMGWLDGLNGSMTGTYVDFNANGIIDVGDKINYVVSVTNTSACAMVVNASQSSFGLTFSGGNFTLAAGATSTNITASYILTQDDINVGSVNHWIGVNGNSNGYSIYTKVFTTVDLSIPSGIHLVAFVDTNGNGTQDSGEPPFNNGVFSYEMNNNGAPHFLYLYQTGGATFYESNPANTYDITFALSGSCAGEYITPITSLNDLTVPNNSGIVTYYFPVTLAPCTDIGVNLYPYSGNPRPGFDYSQIISVHNNGNTVIQNGLITFNHDPAITMSPVSGSAPITNGFTYDIVDLMPGGTYYLLVEFQVPTIPTVSMGQWLHNTVSVTVPTGDVNLANQTDELSQMITASYDPNDKVENHGGHILFSEFTPEDYLTYTIRFENTGTAAAEKVMVTDVLDDKLDTATIRLVDSYHSISAMERVGNMLTITYDGIDLQPSIPDTPIGKGFFVFQVKPKPGYALGDLIMNSASIYFDTNPAIETNTVTTEFVATLATPGFAQQDIRIYPNPAKSTVTIDSSSGVVEHVAISDITGKIVLAKNPNLAETSIDISTLAKGMYFVKIRSQGNEKTVKLIRE